MQTVHIPDELLGRLQRTAHALHASLDVVVQRALAAGLPPGVEDVPPEYRSALEALDAASDDALWALWRNPPPPPAAMRHAALLERQRLAELSPEEQAELEALREAADRHLLRRAQAAALLRWRGHAVPING